MSAADRSLTNASREISNMVSKLNLPKSIEVRPYHHYSIFCTMHATWLLLNVPLQFIYSGGPSLPPRIVVRCSTKRSMSRSS